MERVGNALLKGDFLAGIAKSMLLAGGKLEHSPFRRAFKKVAEFDPNLGADAKLKRTEASDDTPEVPDTMNFGFRKKKKGAGFRADFAAGVSNDGHAV